MISEKSKQNLEKGKRFKKGKSGNPKGRPPGPTAKTVFNYIVDNNLNNEDVISNLSIAFPTMFKGKRKNRTIKEALTMILVAKGLSGDRRSIKDIFDRTDGKPVMSVEHSGPGGVPLQPGKVIIELPDNGRD